MATKACRRCSEVKEASEFPRNAKLKDGIDSYCRECRRVMARESYYRRHGRDTPATKTLMRPRGKRLYDSDGKLTAKTCPDCGQLKPISAFGKNAGSSDGHVAYCRDCHNVRSASSRAAQGGSRHYHYFRRYGIGVEEVDAMYEAQGGKCAACRERPAVHVDHDHVTGKVRGLLCFTCNVALGNIGDDPGRLRALIDYLAAHGVAPITTLTANTRRLPGVAGGFRDEIGPGVWRLRVAA